MPEKPRRLAFPEYIPGSCYYVTRNLFEGLNGFDESFFAYWEDVDLSVRAHRAGYHLWAHPGIHVLHHGRGTTGKNRHYTKELFERNRERFRQKYAV